MPDEIVTRKVNALASKVSMAIVDFSGNNTDVMWGLVNLTNKNKTLILIADESQVEGVPLDLQDYSLFKYKLYGDNADFIKSLDEFLHDIYKRDKSEMMYEKDHLRLIKKGEYDAAVIAAIRYLEIFLSKKFGLARSSLIEYLGLLNTSDEQDRVVLRKVKNYRQIRNTIVHDDVKVGKKRLRK